MKDKLSKYAVFGNPIGHSKSPEIHGYFAHQTHQAMQYTAILVGLDEFEQKVRDFAADGGHGLNVTVPFKQRAWELATELSEQARLAGAVNTLTFNKGEIKGDNTDGIGLVKDLTINHGFDFTGKSILVLGAGGAVRGILGPIIAESPESITIANRTLSNAIEMKSLFASSFDLEVLSFKELNQSYDLIINGTSSSLYNELLPLPDVVVDCNSYLYDMMYSQQTTVFNAWGNRLGARKAIDGLGMLIEQAAAAFTLWRKVSPDTSHVINKLRS